MYRERGSKRRFIHDDRPCLCKTKPSWKSFGNHKRDQRQGKLLIKSFYPIQGTWRIRQGNRIRGQAAWIESWKHIGSSSYVWHLWRAWWWWTLHVLLQWNDQCDSGNKVLIAYTTIFSWEIWWSNRVLWRAKEKWRIWKGSWICPFQLHHRNVIPWTKQAFWFIEIPPQLRQTLFYSGKEDCNS